VRFIKHGIVFWILILFTVGSCAGGRDITYKEYSYHELQTYDPAAQALFVVNIAACPRESPIREILAVYYTIGYPTGYLSAHPEIPWNVRIQKAAGAEYYSFPIVSNPESGPLEVQIRAVYRTKELMEVPVSFRYNAATFDPGKIHLYSFSCDLEGRVRLRFVTESIQDFYGKRVKDRNLVRGVAHDLR